MVNNGDLGCCKIGKFHTLHQFLIATVIVFFFFIIYGYFLELIFRLDGMRTHGWYLTLVQFNLYSIFGLLEKALTGWEKPRVAPLRTYVLLAFLTVTTMGLSNSSVGYLNYPTQVIFKCCKLIPVLVGGILIQGKKYSLLDFIASLCMSIGLIFFTLADSQVQPQFDITGVVMISGALVADAAIGNVQEKTMKRYSSSNAEMILYSYSIGFIYILGGMLATGTFIPAFTFFSDHPLETYGYSVVLSLSGYLGLSAVLYLINMFGALTAVTVTTFRKMLTIILSFLLFSKPFTITYVYSGLVVAVGIFLNIYRKNKAGMDELFCRFVLRRKSRHVDTAPVGLV